MYQEFEHFKIIDFDPKGGPAFFKLINENRSRLEDFFPGTVSDNNTLQDSIQYFQTVDHQIKGRIYFPFILCDKKTSEYIGLVDLKKIDWRIPKAEIGYFIDEKHQGKGIISTAVAAVISYTETEYKFRKILCRAHSENKGSIQVALKNGFELEGIIRNDFRTTKGKMVDLNYYGRIFS